MLSFLILLAEGEVPKQAPASPDMFSFLFLPMMLFFLFYFVVLRPQKRQEQEQRNALLNNLKKNDEVLTLSGIYGSVVAVSDKEDEITLKVADNVRLRMTKASIVRNLTNEEDARAAKAAKEAEKKS